MTTPMASAPKQLETTQGDGASAEADRAAGLTASAPVGSSQSSIASAEAYTTLVVRHADEAAGRAFIQYAHANWPFFPDEPVPTQMTAVSVGDSISVQDAMVVALECEELSQEERIEFALDLNANCFTWDECRSYAEKEWELAYSDGKFTDCSEVAK